MRVSSCFLRNGTLRNTLLIKAKNTMSWLYGPPLIACCGHTKSKITVGAAVPIIIYACCLLLCVGDTFCCCLPVGIIGINEHLRNIVSSKLGSSWTNYHRFYCLVWWLSISFRLGRVLIIPDIRHNNNYHPPAVHRRTICCQCTVWYANWASKICRGGIC